MPTLNWIGKEAVVNHHRQVPFRLLRDVPALSCGDPGSGNLILQGDNLLALKALLPYYAGQVKCIYIDPPYNTGNEEWIYSDNVNHPVIREWLGKVVGKEGETLDRHDRWLCMLYPRLALLKEFLREDGIILVSIGDDEFPSLLHILREIFGIQNESGIFVWKSRAKPANIGSAKFKPQKVAEYVLGFARNASAIKYLPINSGETRNYPHSDKDGRYRLQTILMSNRGDRVRETMRFEIAGFTPSVQQRWKGGREFVQTLFDSNRIEFRNRIPFRKHYKHEEAAEHQPFYTFVPPEVSGTAETGKAELNKILGNMHGFDTVKPTGLLSWLFRAVTREGDIILDSFAGSGSTAHAVLALNKSDGGNRRFIAVELDEKIARPITAERVRRVSEGYDDSNGEKIAGMGSGFRYCELGDTLFDETGKIRETVTFSDLARHVYFTETGESLPKKQVTKSPYLGEYRGTGIYLLYNGILGDKSANGGNILTRQVLAALPPFAGQKVIYCTGCLIGKERLEVENIIVRQTPYEIKIS